MGHWESSPAFAGKGWQGTQRLSTPWKGFPQQIDPAEEGWQEEEFQVSEIDCLRAPEWSVPLNQLHPQWLEQFHSVTWSCQSIIHMAKGVAGRKAPGQQLYRLGWTDHWKYFLVGTVSFPGHSCLFLFVPPLLFICWALYLCSSFWASSVSLLSNWAQAWLMFCRHWRAGLHPNLTSICMPSLKKEGGVDEGINSTTGLERWWASSEHLHRTSWERGYDLYPIPLFTGWIL